MVVEICKPQDFSPKGTGSAWHGDGVGDIAVGAVGDDLRGAVYVLRLNADNRAPTTLTLSANRIPENMVSGTAIGSFATTSAAINGGNVSTTVDIGLIAVLSAPHLPVVDDTSEDRPESIAPSAMLSGDDATPSATDDLFTSLGSATSDLCPW